MQHVRDGISQGGGQACFIFVFPVYHFHWPWRQLNMTDIFDWVTQQTYILTLLMIEKQLAKLLANCVV